MRKVKEVLRLRFELGLPASVFVCVLGASSYTYAEATRDQQLEAWIQAHIHALEFFGGVPTLAVPDNTKPAVTRACRYDPDLNPTYNARIVAGNAADGCQHYELAKYLDRREPDLLEARIVEYKRAIQWWDTSKCGNEAYVFKDTGCALARQVAQSATSATAATAVTAGEYLKKAPPDDSGAKYCQALLAQQSK